MISRRGSAGRRCRAGAASQPHMRGRFSFGAAWGMQGAPGGCCAVTLRRAHSLRCGANAIQ